MRALNRSSRQTHGIAQSAASSSKLWWPSCPSNIVVACKQLRFEFTLIRCMQRLVRLSKKKKVLTKYDISWLLENLLVSAGEINNWVRVKEKKKKWHYSRHVRTVAYLHSTHYKRITHECWFKVNNQINHPSHPLNDLLTLYTPALGEPQEVTLQRYPQHQKQRATDALAVLSLAVRTGWYACTCIRIFHPELLNFWRNLHRSFWTPLPTTPTQHFSRITLSFQCDEPRLYLPERAETFTPFRSGRKTWEAMKYRCGNVLFRAICYR